MKNWKFSAQLVLWASPSIESASDGGNIVAGGHELGDLLSLRLFLEPFHGIKDAADQPFEDRPVVAGEVGAGEPDVGDQPVGVLSRDQHAVALDLRQVVDVGGPGDAAGDVLLRS